MITTDTRSYRGLLVGLAIAVPFWTPVLLWLHYGLGLGR